MHPAPVPPARRYDIRKLLIVGIVIFAGLFVLANVILAASYSGKTYPGSQVAGKHIGSVAFRALPSTLQKADLVPEKITLRYDGKQQTYDAASLGISADTDAMKTSLAQRDWLPVANLFGGQDVALAVKIDDQKFNQALNLIAGQVAADPVEGSVRLEKGAFILTPAKDGKKLDTAKSKQATEAAIGRGADKVELTVADVAPKVANQQLQAQHRRLESAQKTSVNYSYGNKKHQVTAADISGWYQQTKDGAFQLTDENIKSYVLFVSHKLGVAPKNLDQAVTQTKQAAENAKPLDFKLTGSAYTPSKTLTYCTGVRGVDASYLPELERKLAMTYADPRGWGLPDGQVHFVHGNANCNLTVWLASPDQMTSFGNICDPVWSCTVAPNVIINFERWTNATDPWNAENRNIDDYHTMAINHESGHEFGFNHVGCPGAGQPAPVMEQQSINLQGCTFNPWPTPSEQANFKALLGI